ncbi:MAG: alpha/beta fold hydrolase [Candidatus Levybacteria bacterium]|nr:alpha/beta fold hydrolase [Candidatus Levybacteria bacterium]
MEEKSLQDSYYEQTVITKAQKRKKILLLLVGLLGFNIFVWGTLYLALSNNKTNTANPGNIVSSKINATPTPFPFAEITIPYLRSRTYKSSLGELSQVSTNSEYTSYLTSYDSDGFKVNGLLTIPTGEEASGGWPAIILVHGYIPPQNYQTLTSYAQYVDYLARRGFVVFKIDLRGHGNSQGEPGGSYYSSDYIIDVLNAKAALASSKDPTNRSGRFVEPNRIGLWGHSMAGNVVVRALAARPDIPAVVIFAGAVYTYSDFSQFRIQDSSYQSPSEDSPARKRRNEMFEIYGQFDPTSSFWKQVPMTNYLDEIKGAVSINHAVNDSVVSIEYSRNLKRILDSTDIVHELNEYPSGGHNFEGVAFNQAMQNSVEFFDKYLK